LPRQVENAFLSSAPEGFEVGDASVRDVSGTSGALPDVAMPSPGAVTMTLIGWVLLGAALLSRMILR